MSDNRGVFLKGARVLVTGANGFVGRHLLGALKARGARVSALDIAPCEFDGIERSFTGDLKNADFTSLSVKESDPEIIVHLAASKDRSASVEAFSEAIATNLIGSMNLIASAMKLKNLSSIVVLGTAEEYGRNVVPFAEGMRERPISAYSYSKLCVTRLCESLHLLHGLPATILRPTIAYGPGQGEEMFLPSLIGALLAGKEFKMTHGRQTRDFIYVEDLVEAIIAAASLGKKGAGRVINIGCGLPVTIEEVALKVAGKLGAEKLLRLGAIEYRPAEAMEYHVDTALAREVLGWSARVGLDEGLDLTIEGFKRGSRP